MMTQGLEVSLQGQMYVFVCMLLCGAASGVLSDAFTQFRRMCGYARITTGVADILLWAAVALGIFFVNLAVNSGQLRWYGILGLFLGAAVYFLTISHVVRPILKFVFFVVKKILLFILKIVLTTLAFLYKIINGIFLSVARLFAPLAKKTGRQCANVRREFGKLKLVLRKR